MQGAFFVTAGGFFVTAGGYFVTIAFLHMYKQPSNSDAIM